MWLQNEYGARVQCIVIGQLFVYLLHVTLSVNKRLDFYRFYSVW